MGGVGSFSRENRTLYVGGLRRVRGVDLEDLVRRNFVEWGKLESVRVIHDKSIAFVRYTLRAAAEFAKEAMTDQSLGYKEILNVRWANDDPNPRAQQEQSQTNEEQVRAAVLATYGMGAYPDMRDLNTGDAYPNTDEQFGGPGQQLQRTGQTTTTTDQASAQATSGVQDGQSGQPEQQHYTKEQWRAWYEYYYGYVPEGFDDAAPQASADTQETQATDDNPPKRRKSGKEAKDKKQRVEA